MEQNSLNGLQSQNTNRNSTIGLPIRPLAIPEINNQQPSLYSELSPEKYLHVLDRVKCHESNLANIESNIVACALNLQRYLIAAKQEISSKLSQVKQFCDSLMNEVDNRLKSIYEVIGKDHRKLSELLQISREYLQTHKENPDKFIINSKQASAILKITDLPRFDTEMMFTLEQDAINQMKSKLDDLLTEIEKCKKDIRISANRVSEDKYIVIIDDQKLEFETKEGYLTSYLGETELLANQVLTQPEDTKDENVLLDNYIEQINQTEEKKAENSLADIPIEQNISDIRNHAYSVSQSPETMQEYMQEEHKSPQTVNEEQYVENPLDEEIKSSSNHSPQSCKTIKRQYSHRRKRLHKNIESSSSSDCSSDDLDKFIVADTESEYAGSDDEYLPGPESKANESQVLKEYNELQRKLRQTENRISDKRTKRFRAS